MAWTLIGIGIGVAVVVGRVTRARDRQIPFDTCYETPHRLPGPAAERLAVIVMTTYRRTHPHSSALQVGGAYRGANELRGAHTYEIVAVLTRK